MGVASDMLSNMLDILPVLFVQSFLTRIRLYHILAMLSSTTQLGYNNRLIATCIYRRHSIAATNSSVGFSCV